jgi:hypothetical protein
VNHRLRASQRPVIALILLLVLPAAPLHARPMITEEVATVGKLMFEAGFKASYRVDSFKAPEKTDYETVNIPVEAKLGLSPRLEAGVVLNYVSHRLDTPNALYSGSRTALFSPEVKYSPWSAFGLQIIYHTAIAEEETQELPVARGDDYEVKALFRVPMRVPLQINLGYLFRNSYSTRFGVEGGPKYRVEPSDVAEASIAAEIPLKWGFGLLTEAAYYRVGEQSTADVTNEESDGEAMDALVGLTWTRGGWALGTGVAFGLLDESHTSFDLQRGAGDYQLRWMASYRLKPRKPGQ